MLDDFFFQTLVVAGKLYEIGSALLAVGDARLEARRSCTTGSDLGDDELKPILVRQSTPVAVQFFVREESTPGAA